MLQRSTVRSYPFSADGSILRRNSGDPASGVQGHATQFGEEGKTTSVKHKSGSSESTALQRWKRARKAEHAVDLTKGALLAVTLQPANEGDTTTIHKTLEEAQTAACEI